MDEKKQAVNLSPANEEDKALRHVDIQVVIDYFGVTELLDTIGISKIESYLLMRQTDQNHPRNPTSSEPKK